jgi:hypothetical protein
VKPTVEELQALPESNEQVAAFKRLSILLAQIRDLLIDMQPRGPREKWPNE